MSEKLALLEQFRAACATVNMDAAAGRIVKMTPELASFHVRDGRGHFVTALDIAMSAGKPKLVDQLLSMGARMDLPVGLPPSANTIGHTSMTRVLDRHYAARTPNYNAIAESMIRHHGLREMERQKTPVLTALKSLTDNIMRRAGTVLRNAIAGDKGKLTAAMVPVTAIGVTAGLMMQDAITQPVQTAAIAASAVVAGGILLAQKYAQNDQEGDRLRLHQMQAVDVFDAQAGIEPKVRALRLPPLTNNVLEEEPDEASTMSMGC